MANTQANVLSWLTSVMDGELIPNAAAVNGPNGCDSLFVHQNPCFFMNSDEEIGTGPGPAIRSLRPEFPQVPGLTSKPATQRRRRRSSQTSNVTAKVPSTSALNRSKSSANPAKKQRLGTQEQSSMKLKTQIKMTQEMRRVLMVVILDCHKDGLLMINRPSHMKTAYKRIAKRMAVSFPEYKWTEAQGKRKFEGEKRRWQHWLAFDKSGYGPDENRLMQAPPKVFDILIARYPAAAWVRSEPLGDVSVYREVFFKKSALGSYIREAGDEDDLPDRLGTGTHGGDELSRGTIYIDDSIGEETESVQVKVTSTQLVTRKSSKEPARKRKRYDPDLDTELSSDSSSVELVIPQNCRVSVWTITKQEWEPPQTFGGADF